MINRNALRVSPETKARNNAVVADRIMNVLALSPGSTVLEVGCGGAEMSLALSERYGLDCRGLEPFPQYEPLIDPARVTQGVAEHMPFDDGSFDLVIAKDVIEHVDDVRASMNELLRVSRKYVYIAGPNYLYPYEAHFKVPFPPKLPKSLAYWYLRLLRFDKEEVKFLQHINYVTKPGLLRSIRLSPVVDQVTAVVDLQMSKRFKRMNVLAQSLDLFLNDKIELLIIKG